MSSAVALAALPCSCLAPTYLAVRGGGLVDVLLVGYGLAHALDVALERQLVQAREQAHDRDD